MEQPIWKGGKLVSDVFDGIIFPQKPRNEIVVGMDEKEYRSAPGISPSSIKMAIEDLGGYGQPRGSAARLRAHLAGEIKNKQSKSMSLGTAAHKLTLESGDVCIIDDEQREALSEKRLERKREAMIKDYSSCKFLCNFSEAKKFKAEKGRPPEDHEKESLIAARVERELENDSGLNIKSKEILIYANDRMVIDSSLADHNTALAMKRALDNAPMNYEARELLSNIDDIERRTEISIFCVIEIQVSANLKIPVQLKGRADLVPDGEYIDDYKTCRSIHIEDFSKEAIKRGYFLSMAVYNKMLRKLAETLPDDVCNFYSLSKKRKARLIVQETTAPYEAQVYDIPAAHLQAGWHFADFALKDVCRRYLADRKGERDAWKTCTETRLLDPLYPASISHYILEMATVETSTQC